MGVELVGFRVNYICTGGATLVQDIKRSRKYCVYVVSIEISADHTFTCVLTFINDSTFINMTSHLVYVTHIYECDL